MGCDKEIYKIELFFKFPSLLFRKNKLLVRNSQRD